MGKLMSTDAENGKETYEALLKECENFNPDDRLVIINSEKLDKAVEEVR